MTPALPIASAPTDGRMPNPRDGASGGSGQNGDASSFEGILADVEGSTATPGATTPGATSGTTTSISSFLQLLKGGAAADDDAATSKNGSSRPDKNDTASDPTPVADPTALGASAAMAALQSASTQTQLAAGGTVTLASAKQTGAASTTMPSRAPPVGDDTDLVDASSAAEAAIPSAVSVVKLETHLVTTAASTSASNPKGQGEHSPTSSATSSPLQGAAIGVKAPTGAAPVSTTPAPTTSAQPDASDLAAAAPATPIQTIANVVAKLAATPPANVPTEATPVPVAPPRTMTIQLTPANLGTVSVTMHLTGQALDLQLAVSDQNTLGALNRDRDSLSQAVQNQGYDLRSLVIQGTDGQSTASSSGNPSGGAQTNPQMQSRSDEQSSQSGGGGGNNSGDSQQQQSRGNPTNDASRLSVSADAGAGGLFV